MTDDLAQNALAELELGDRRNILLCESLSITRDQRAFRVAEGENGGAEFDNLEGGELGDVAGAGDEYSGLCLVKAKGRPSRGRDEGNHLQAVVDEAIAWKRLNEDCLVFKEQGYRNVPVASGLVKEPPQVGPLPVRTPVHSLRIFLYAPKRYPISRPPVPMSPIIEKASVRNRVWTFVQSAADQLERRYQDQCGGRARA